MQGPWHVGCPGSLDVLASARAGNRVALGISAEALQGPCFLGSSRPFRCALVRARVELLCLPFFHGRKWLPSVFLPRALVVPGTSSHPGPLDVLAASRARVELGACGFRALGPRGPWHVASSLSYRCARVFCVRARLLPWVFARAELVAFGFFASGLMVPGTSARPGPLDLLAAARARADPVAFWFLALVPPGPFA